MDAKKFSKLSHSAPWEIEEELKVKLDHSILLILGQGLIGFTTWAVVDLFLYRREVQWIADITWGAIMVIGFFAHYGGLRYISPSRLSWLCKVKKIKRQNAGRLYCQLAEERARQRGAQVVQLGTVEKLQSEMTYWWKVACEEAGVQEETGSTASSANHIPSVHALLEESATLRQEREAALIEVEQNNKAQ